MSIWPFPILFVFLKLYLLHITRAHLQSCREVAGTKNWGRGKYVRNTTTFFLVLRINDENNTQYEPHSSILP